MAARKTADDDSQRQAAAPYASLLISLSDAGYLKALPLESFRLQRRAGKGAQGQQTREGGNVRQIVVADTQDWLYFFTNKGRVYRQRVLSLPADASWWNPGRAAAGTISIMPAERVTAITPIRDPYANKSIIIATRKGSVKRMHLGKFVNIRANGLAAMSIRDDDEVLIARLADDDMSTIIVTREGKAVRSAIGALRPRITRGAGGVRGVRLEPGDEVVGMDVARPKDRLLLLTRSGYGKRTEASKFPLTDREAMGVIAQIVNDKTGLVAAAVVADSDNEEVIVGSAKAMVLRTRIDEWPIQGRAAEGVRVMTELSDDDRVISVGAFTPHGESSPGRRTNLLQLPLDMRP